MQTPTLQKIKKTQHKHKNMNNYTSIRAGKVWHILYLIIYVFTELKENHQRVGGSLSLLPS